jgi:hypothetical protein
VKHNGHLAIFCSDSVLNLTSLSTLFSEDFLECEASA